MPRFLQSSRLVLALSLLLFWESSVQGYPMRRGRYQWVRCNPESNSANCIEEGGPMFDLPPGESNRILPPRTDPFSMTRFQNMRDTFPLSEDYSGSGSGSGSGFDNGFPAEIEQEYQAIDEDDAFYYNAQPLERNLPSDNQHMDQDGSEDDFII
ncbi:serglycin [Dasypus novemcinctus]|uniref:serglycin n=1 Tax=Dasypus novemcinctus TaxID=9361 RepID=UPI0003290F84|nr:serglycin [Dasypus novemcinctus]